MLNEAASKLRDKGIIIYAVGVGKANQNELEIIAGNKNNTIHVDDFDKLKDVYHTLQESMCNNSQEVCNIPKADVIFLCDSSSRVSDSEFVTMTTFLSDLSDNFDIQSQKIKLGLAQFGSIYKELVGLSDSLTKSQWKNQIQTIKKINGSPQVDHALSKVKFMFDPSVGGRRNAGVPQTLVVILSGPPQGNVSEAVKDLRDLGICVLAWGVGDVQKQQLLSITDNPGKIVTFQDFTKLKDMDVRKRMVREICQSCGKTNCFVDIVVGFDISTHLPGQRLFHGHSPLESYLPGILEDITSIRGVSCGAGAETQVSVAFKVNSEENFPAKFQIYQKAMFGSLLQPLTVNGSSQLNAQFLQWLWDTFESRDTAQVQVLLIFSDGIGGQSITLLEDKSDRLREAGLDALLVVSLDPAAHDQFSSFEFGKGFDYRTHLTIGMRELGGLLSQYLGNIAERTCCCTFCKCTGPPGPPGAPGVANVKGSPGLKGSRGHRGEDGDPGTRGEKGLPGEKGTAGCPGERGQKGAQGFCGQEGEHGEDGIDGVNGEEGIHGSPGEKGENGDPGSQGSPGIRGSPGEYGKKGFSGDPGIPGINSNIKGQKGFKGGQGRQGRTGQNGMKGSPGPKGSRGREGQRGVRGLPGVPGIPGPKGELGPEGLQGPQGRRGLPGRKGEKGSHGPVGPQGSSGPMGAKGNHGRPGPLGRKGEPGFSGDRGQVGQAGQRGKQGDNGIPGYGQMGRKGIKGPRGFLGDMGQKGNVGDPGIPGSPGPKGFKGLSAFEGLKGEAGSRGPPGPPGRRGVKGMAGLPVYSQCDLIQFMRDHSPCWKKKCPVYPTELVFALDQSYDITEQRFNAMVDIMHSIISNLHIMENNCPVGARVAVTAYDSHAWYLIRWFDYHNKKQLLQLLSQINYQPPTAPQDIGNAMRFVARNVFKRTYAGPNVRRVAVFFSNRQAASLSSIITATMEFSAWDISPAVIAFNERVFLDEAFEFDNTGTFQVIPIPPYGQSESEQIERLWNCTLCYDKCFPNVCAKEIILPEDSYMDVALLLENSQYIVNDELQALKTLVSSMLDSFNIASAPLSSNGDRIALLSYSPWDSSIRRGAVKTEFDFTAYSDKLLMKNYIQTHLQQLSGEATISDSLKWTIENLFPRTPNLRRHKVIFVVSAGENYEKRHFLERIALRAKCQGFVIVVISLGPTHKDHLEELASDPRDHHLIRLGRIHKPDLDYIVKSLKPVVYSIRRGLNQYPSQMLKNICRHIHTEEEDYPLFTPKPQEIALGENRFIEQEFSARRDSPLVLEDNGSDHLVYLPNHMVMPQELMINYEKVQDSEEVASLTSGDENHGRKEELGLTYQPGDASLQEYYMDVAFLIDASHRVGNDDFEEVKAFIISVLDYFHVAPDPLTSTLGDRVAVLSYSPSGYMPNTEECPVYLEFDLVTYSSVYQMKHHLQNSLLKLNGDVFIGHALQWTIDNVFARTPNLKKNKVIFVISAGETNPLDKEVLRNVSLRAKCEGYSIFVFSFGPTHNEKELEELASHPLDHHLVQLGRTHKPDLNYIIKFIKPFVHLIRRAINKYPPADLRLKCVNITFPTPENVGTENIVFLIPGVYEIETENGELSDEFGSQEQHFFALGNNQSNGSGTTTDLIQKLYLLFSTGELRTKDKEEAHSEEITALANDKPRDEKMVRT